MALVSAEELSERQAYVNRIQNDQAKLQSSLAGLLERLQWTPQHFLEQDSAKVTCSYCPHHKMSVESLKKHEEVCYWIQHGYTIEELNNEPPSSAFFYENSKIMTINLEKYVMNAILDEHHSEIRKISSDRDVPQTLAASQVDLSRSERLAIYEHVVQQAKDHLRMQSMSEDSLLTVDFEALIKKSAKCKEYGEPSSEAEKWAAMRDYKRRRQSYRAKNVHITKKTYTEIIREVIQNQVDLLQEDIQSEEKDHENRSSSSKHDGDRKSKRSSSDSKSRSSSRKRERESPDRRKRETANRSELRAKDQKSPDRRRRDRDSPDHSRKRDHNKSPESRTRRSRDSPEQRRNRSISHSTRKRDRKSPDARKRDKENPERRCRKVDFEESSTKMYDRENLEGVSRNKSPEHKKRKLECEPVAERKSLTERHELERLSPKGTSTTSAGDKVGVEQFGNMNESLPEGTSSKWLSSNEEFNDSDGSASHTHCQKHKKSKKKHKKHKH